MNTQRKQYIYAELARRQAEIDAAKENSLSWDYRNQTLELVERLPENEQRQWKSTNMAKLRVVACGPGGRTGRE